MERTVDDALSEAGAGRFQRRLMAIFGLVWAADAMQVVAVGFAAPSIAKHFAQLGLFVFDRCQDERCRV